ncbi:MAG: ROK family protein [Candidatus Anammoxibacter sp.]
MKMFQIGIDLGGTKIEGIVLDGNCNECFRHRIPTEQEKGYDHILQNIKRVYDMMFLKIDGKEHSLVTLGIGVPGAVSHQTGTLKNSNTLCLNKRPLKTDIECLLDRELEIENDANCFALAEARFGAGKGNRVVFGVIMGTGCGGGLVYQGKVISGKQSITGEWGHMSIDPAGPACYCGSRGCVETFISGSGLEQLYKTQFGKNIKLSEIVDNFRKGEKDNVKFIKQFFVNFGRSMANLINVLDPDIIVLGGGVSNIDEIYTEGVKEVRNQVFSDSLETPIVRNKLGDSAGVIGAALIGSKNNQSLYY